MKGLQQSHRNGPKPKTRFPVHYYSFCCHRTLSKNCLGLGLFFFQGVLFLLYGCTVSHISLQTLTTVPSLNYLCFFPGQLFFVDLDLCHLCCWCFLSVWEALTVYSEFKMGARVDFSIWLVWFSSTVVQIGLFSRYICSVSRITGWALTGSDWHWKTFIQGPQAGSLQMNGQFFLIFWPPAWHPE